MTRRELLQFMRDQKHAVEASVGAAGPQAAVVGIVVSDNFEIFFDTLDSTRKALNLREDPRIAFVIGDVTDATARTVQCSGLVDEPAGADLDRLKGLYFARFPDGPGRESWPGITYLRARLNWVRFSDFAQDPPVVLEFNEAELATLH